MSKYTIVDNLDEDKPIPGQKYGLYSFLSPEGIANCNIRGFKNRGSFDTLKEAEEEAKKIEQEDKYFKIFIGENFKWLEFDPPSTKVEMGVKTSNPDHQKLLDAQHKMRMDKLNAVATKKKERIDKQEKGRKEVIEESKKAGAASSAVEKRRNKKQEEKQLATSTDKQSATPTEKKEEKRLTVQKNTRAAAAEKIRERMRKRLASNQNKKSLESLDRETLAKDNRSNTKTNAKSITPATTANTFVKTQSNANDKNKMDLDTKSKVVGKITSELEDQKTKLAEADKNIENIKQLLAKRRAEKK